MTPRSTVLDFDVAPPADVASTVRMAWLGPMPVDGGGVSGVVWDLLAGLGPGLSVDYFAQTAPTAPELAAARATLTNASIHAGTTWWTWQRWYSKDPLLAFLTGLVARRATMRDAWLNLADAHAQSPYDVILQVSAIELLGVRHVGSPRPPIVILPETHMAGELRALVGEWAVARRCMPLWRNVVNVVLFAARSLRQRIDIRRAERVVAISSRFGDQIVRDYKYPSAQVVRVPNPVNCECFAPAPSDPPTSAGRVLFAGRISARKGIDTLVAVAERLQRLRPGAELVIVGGHSLWSDYRPLLADLPPNATYRGRLSRDELRVELQQADVFLQPSTYEPFALTVAEALACGTPVVTSDEVGASESAPALACRRVAPNDPDAMAEATAELLDAVSDPERADRIRAAARDHAVATFDRATVARSLVAALSDAVVR